MTYTFKKFIYAAAKDTVRLTSKEFNELIDTIPESVFASFDFSTSYYHEKENVFFLKILGAEVMVSE